MEIFHKGERYIHDLLGIRALTDSKIEAMVEPVITKEYENFINDQTVLMVGSTDEKGKVWCSFLAGSPGVLKVLEPGILNINLKLNTFDPLFSNIQFKKEVGIVIIDFATKSRVRINGAVSNDASDGQIQVKVEHVYGNCPRYLQVRTFSLGEERAERLNQHEISYHGSTLLEYQQDLIRKSDTFIIASSSAEGKMDASHKGGMPGFVYVVNEKTLMIPDYAGNMLFNTLGNIVENPNVGLLFIDFETGDTLQLAGTAEILWNIDKEILSRFPGAQRLMQFSVAEALQTYTSKRYQWKFLNDSPDNPKEPV